MFDGVWAYQSRVPLYNCSKIRLGSILNTIFWFIEYGWLVISKNCAFRNLYMYLLTGKIQPPQSISRDVCLFVNPVINEIFIAKDSWKMKLDDTLRRVLC